MKRKYHYCVGLSALAFALFGGPESKADTLGFTSPGGLTTNLGAGNPVNLGLVFTANTTFTIDALGIYDQSSLTGPEQVGLYDSSGNLLVSTTVTLSDSLVNGYLFQSIAPVALSAGATYTIVANTGNNPWAYGPVQTSPDITFKYNDYFYGSSLAFPTTTGGWGPAYYGANFEIESVPEPGSLGPLMAVGLLAACAYFSKRSFGQPGQNSAHC